MNHSFPVLRPFGLLRAINRPGSSRGTVLLVALCFVAVMGIVLGSYLAVCTRAMQLSNRSFQVGLSKQLAEAGIDEALRAFNKNDWSGWSSGGTSVVWDTTTYAADKRAVATMTFPTTKFGQGVTAEVKIRVDNSDAHVLASAWIETKSYQIGDVVGYGGNWFTCVTAHSNQTPTATGNLAYWVPAPIPWKWSEHITYSQNDAVNYEGTWYRCAPSALTAADSDDIPSPENTTDWVTIPSNVQTWLPGTTYVEYDIVTHNSRNYRSLGNNTNQPPPDTTYWSEEVKSISLSWESDKKYTKGAIVFSSGSWYSCIENHLSGSTLAADLALGYWDSSDWVAGTVYSVGDVVYRPSTGIWYSCDTAHTSGTSFSTANWNSAYWSSLSIDYPVGGIVYYTTNSTWYRCIVAHTSSSTFVPTSTTFLYWTPASWSTGTDYVPGDRVNYHGAWYSCVSPHTSGAFTTDLTTKWTLSDPDPYTALHQTPTNFVSWQYLVKAYQFNDVSYYSTSGSGTWYRRDKNSPTTVDVPTSASNWENALTASWDWASGDDYNIGDVVYLSGSFYRCIQAHTTSHTPPNTTYWSTEPLFSTYWDAGKNYTANDVVRYRGSWYRNLTGSNTRPGTDDDNWAIAARAVEPWSSSKIYHIDDIVSSGGNWYRSKVEHTNQTVANDNAYWGQVAGHAFVWSASTSYAANSYVSYGGAWYKCIAATTANAGHTPNNTTYWTPTWTQSSGVSTGAPVVYAEATVTLGDGTTSKTQLRATIDLASLFPNAVGSTTTLTISNSGGTVDSYDSADPSANPGYSAVLAASSASASAITITNTTTINGYLAQPTPGANISTNTTVWGATSLASPKVDTSRVSRSPYIPDFDIRTPIQQTPLPGTIPSVLNLGTPGSPTPSIYYDTNWNLTANQTININGPVIIYLNGYLRLNPATINITSTGSAVIHFTYLRVYAGSGGINNLTKDPKKLILLGSISGTTTNYLIKPFDFYGAIYMPDTTATLGLDIRTGNKIFGALSAREITFSAEANVHYDTSLRYATFTGVDQPYTVTDWRELSLTEQATMSPED